MAIPPRGSLRRCGAGDGPPHPTGRAARARWATRALLLCISFAALTACAPATGVDADGVLHLRADTRDGVHVLRVPATGVGRTIAVRRTLFSSFVVPRGFAPPPGTCRVWHHDRAPALQPPPGACPELERLAPRGSYLIYG